MENNNMNNNVGNINGCECTVKYIPVNQIKMANYQRPVNLARAMKIAKEYEPSRMRPIEVSYRDGEYWCYDGQHRVRVYAAKNFTHIPAQIHTGLTYKDEARLFAEQHRNEYKISKADEWKARVEAGYKCQDALAIKSVCAEFGYRVDVEHTAQNLNPRNIRSIGRLQKCYEKFGENGLRSVLFITNKAWSDLPKAVHQEILGAFIKIMDVYGYKDDAMWNRLCDKLSLITPSALLQMSNKGDRRGSKQVAITMIDLYNKGLRTNRLDVRKIK